ncbi:hydroxyglutarate oxidase [Tessaracoccus aquimaris]|uniref:Hydroxyglutarate oxidase n=1 Tax=Tessaracoccus aquimaris TaxID=1332264 RepID=A0A1Q2CSA5_9ACTN|nr:L-2-hydroxyglutarate oxidase [Tessaracoccus aquimaris]AQP49018.1 hydroxyglutarate oxidase [Tessaracoccus aquimaris]
MIDADVVVVGGGIVGVATAMTYLERNPGVSVTLVEKGALAGQQSGHNSGVIHAGVYYQPGSLKARLCRAGAAWTKRFAAQQGIDFRVPGKLIVATRPTELGRLAALERRAVTNGLRPERLDVAELRRREPHVRGLAALLVAESGIVSYPAVVDAMARLFRAAGGEIRLGAEVVGIGEDDRGVTVEVATGAPIRARRLVACAGIQADRVARLAGVGDGFAMVPFRGEYYRLPEARSGLVSSLIYPVPEPGMPFLGVHLTPTIDGGITVGPNAVLGLAREGYPKWSLDRSDVAELIRFRGFRRMVPGLLRTGLGELWNSAVKPGYLARIRRYCPELRLADLLPHEAGIRAQAVLEDGSMVEDFMFRSTPRQVHVVNAPSPAATSARPIAEAICAQVDAG